MKILLLAIVSLFSTVTWVDRNGRPLNRNRNRDTHREKQKPMEVHRLEDDSVTARTKEMQKSRGYVSESERKAQLAKSKMKDAALPEARKCAGLFGMKLGDVFDPKSRGPVSEGEYAFEPEKPFRSYTQYTVKVLPESKRVYEIRAKAESSLDKSERDIVLALLEKKFETTARGSVIRFRGETGAGDGRSVTVSSTGLVAVDLALKKLLKSERKSAASAAAAGCEDDLKAL